MNKTVKSLIFVVVLGCVCVGLLLGIRGYTTPIIEKNQEDFLKSTILEAAGIPFDKTTLDATFNDKIRTEEKGDFEYFLTPEGLYIFEWKGRGLWGMIEGVMTLDPNLETIKAVKIIYQEETPGLGGRIGEQSYLDMFIGKEFAPKLVLAMRRKAATPGEIDTITGATLTSQALVNILNESQENFKKLIRE